jgi:deoxyribodipyrimidine photo-lyase
MNIWWIRRDLRLSDNQALHAALAAGEPVVPVFILDPRLLAAPAAGEKRRSFLFGGLAALDADLRARGARLILRRGDPAAELARLARETAATAVYAEENVSPYARRRDAEVAAAVPLRLLPGLTIRPADLVRKADGGVYTVFTPYSRAWRALPLPGRSNLWPAPARLAPPPEDLASLPLAEAAPPTPATIGFPPGEAEARRRLHAFLSAAAAGEQQGAAGGSSAPIARYANERDRVDLAGTSQLSPYLRFGMVSARKCAVAALEAAAAGGAGQTGAETWLNELIWREFYIAILLHFPNVLQEAFRPELRAIPWVNDAAQFAAWRAGRTGYPIVDAAMRQLNETGWMHNRARMIVASFLVKDLLIDWRWGERYFMQCLLDGDPAANNGGWQWTAGVGTDAAPYFRVFNPTLQAAKFDPHAAYVRRWVPEVARLPDKLIHAPWLAPADAQRRAGCIIGRDYSAPIVDHAAARARVLVAYRARPAAAG